MKISEIIISNLINILFMNWLVIDVLLLIILDPSFRKKVIKNQDQLHKRYIKMKRDKLDWIADILPQILSTFIAGGVVYLIVSLVSDTVIQAFLKAYTGILAVTLLSMVYDWVKERTEENKVLWKIIFYIYLILFSAICYTVDAEKIIMESRYRWVLNVLITIFVVLALKMLSEICKEIRQQYSIKRLLKGIRKDLYQRTSTIDTEMPNVKLIKCCEKYFVEYLYRCTKIKNISTIEYVNLFKISKTAWGGREIKFMKGFALVSITVGVIGAFCWNIYGLLPISLGIIVLVAISKYLIRRSQQMDSEYIYVIMMRVFYDDWGYYLRYPGGSEFVGTVQLVEASKYHKYVHAFLDIVALCRAITISDQLEGKNRIHIVTSNLSELFRDYGEGEQDKNWVTLIPLWAATLFEFSENGRINAEAKPILLECVDENVKTDIRAFLQSFWVDMKRRRLSDGVAEFVQAFEAELYGRGEKAAIKTATATPPE